MYKMIINVLSIIITIDLITNDLRDKGIYNHNLSVNFDMLTNMLLSLSY